MDPNVTEESVKQLLDRFAVMHPDSPARRVLDWWPGTSNKWHLLVSGKLDTLLPTEINYKSPYDLIFFGLDQLFFVEGKNQRADEWKVGFFKTLCSRVLLECMELEYRPPFQAGGDSAPGYETWSGSEMEWKWAHQALCTCAPHWDPGCVTGLFEPAGVLLTAEWLADTCCRAKQSRLAMIFRAIPAPWEDAVRACLDDDINRWITTCEWFRNYQF